MARLLLILALLATGCPSGAVPADDDDTPTDDDDSAPDDDDSAAEDGDGDGYTVAQGDCDDADPAVHPGAVEVCDAADIDEDCDGGADDLDPEGPSDPSPWYLDADQDGFGLQSASALRCDPVGGMSAVAGDCDDTDATSYPGATRRCDGRDNDCDGAVTDQGLVTVALTGATFTSIQAAVDDAPLGQVVTVCSGTYGETVALSQALFLVSLDGRDTTIINAAGAAAAVTVSADSVVIDGFTVLGGDVGLQASGVVNLTVRSTTFRDAATGPGIAIGDVAGLSLTDVHVLDSPGVGLAIATSDGLVQDLVARGGQGTGVALDGATVTVEDAVVELNTSATPGGGLAITGGAVTILDSEIRDNSAPSAAGLLVAGPTTWSDGELLRNTSTGSAALGAVHVTWSLVLDNVDGGSGPDDNAPGDLEVSGQTWSIPAQAIACYGPADSAAPWIGCQ